jgi:hypothetical protein
LGTQEGLLLGLLVPSLSIFYSLYTVSKTSYFGAAVLRRSPFASGSDFSGLEDDRKVKEARK